MATAHTPADLVRDAEDALTAARAAASFLAAHPGLPVARMHACGVDGQGHPGPLLELQLEEHSAGIAADWARAAIGAEPQQEQWLNRVEHRVTVQFAGVTVLVTAFEDAPEDDEDDL